MARDKLHFKPRFYILLLILTLLIILGSLQIFSKPQPQLVQQGIITYEQKFDTIIVRNEQVFSVNDYGKVVMSVGEGQRVSANTKIAEIYTWDYSDRTTDELLGVQQLIENYQKDNVLKNIVNNDLEALNTKINENIDKIKKSVNSESSEDLLKLEQQLRIYLSDKETLVKSLIKNPDTELQSLYDREASILERIQKYKKDVIAEKAGIVSFYFDGLEVTLTPENIEQLNKKTLDNIVKGNYKKQLTQVDGQKALYRLVDNSKWYCLVRGSKNGIPELKLNETYDIKFDGVNDMPYQAKVVALRRIEDSSGSETLYTFEISAELDPLLSVRIKEATFKKEFEGNKIRNSSIVEKDGVKGVYVGTVNDGKVFVKINILIQDNESAIVEFVDTDMTSFYVY